MNEKALNVYNIQGINITHANNKGKNINQHKLIKLSYVNLGNEALIHTNVNINNITLITQANPYNEPSIKLYINEYCEHKPILLKLNNIISSNK
jgi:hypothetical protein